jgi:hypothetical protein
MKTNQLILSTIASLALVATSCKKDNTTTPAAEDTSAGEVTLKFVNKVNNSDLVLSTATNKVWYTNQNADSFTVTKFNYYITNIKMVAEDGSTFAEPESYHLIQQNDLASQNFTIKNIPAKKYVSINYMIGVDSLRNVSGAQTGALDPIKDMFWTWSSGYIFVKFEGNSPSSTSPSKSLVFHIGGYKDQFIGIKNNTVNLPIATAISGSNNKTITFKTEVNELFKNPQKIDFAILNFAMAPSANTKKIADNYVDMISISAVE